jgi:hypothetical protein
MKKLNFKCLSSICAIAIILIMQSVCYADFSAFREVRIENEDFRPFLAANPLLMELAGARIVNFEDGSRLIVSIGNTDTREPSSRELMRQRTVARRHALAHLAAEQGVQVSTLSRFSDHSMIRVEDGVETGTSISESFQMTQSQASALMQGLPVIATWYSKDGGIFYLAIGKRFQRDELE